MTFIQITSIFGIISGIISLILSISMLKNYLETKLSATLVLSLILLGLNQHTFLLAALILLPKQLFFVAFGLFITLYIFLFFVLFLVFLFFEYLDSGTVHTRLLFLIGILLGICYTILFIPGQLQIVFNDTFQVWISETDILFEGTLLVFGTILLYKVIKASKAVFEKTLTKKLKNLFKQAMIGFLVGFGSIIFLASIGNVIIPFNFIVGAFLRGSYPVILIPCLIIIYRAFMVNPYSIFLISQKIYKLIVFRKDAITIFEYEFLESPSKSAILITGAIHGVSSMIQTALGIESYPKILKYSDRVILFEFQEDFGVALIADSDSRVLRDGLNEFSSKFSQEFKNEIKNWKGKLQDLNKAFQIVKKSFPFADIE
ncbi:MAG: hypothetical protein EAX96_04180 [Candidatus Lokiarchaeota archaeon]|nr:hypothetical protein [Candidatus Lokiarchaeota archaeon]